jgi:hypothetical protein
MQRAVDVRGDVRQVAGEHAPHDGIGTQEIDGELRR